MKKSINNIFYSLIIGATLLSTSCKKDDDAPVTLKGSGSYKMSVLNGTSPVSGAKVVLYNSKTENHLYTLQSDNSGTVDFGSLIEGNYSTVIEVNEPYSKVVQEFQVVSGQNKEGKVQINEHTGRLSYARLTVVGNAEIKTNSGLGVVLIPVNDAFLNARTDEEKFALKSNLKYFGTEGKISFPDMSTGDYAIYKVYDDKLGDRIESNLTLRRGDEIFHRLYINEPLEGLLKKSSWKFKSAARTDDESVYETYPITSFGVTVKNGQYNVKIVFYDGAESTGTADISNGYSYEGWSYIFMNSLTTTQQISSSLSGSSIQYRINSDGKLEVRINFLEVRDYINSYYGQGAKYFYTPFTHIITLE